jgi:hypothetical protein
MNAPANENAALEGRKGILESPTVQIHQQQLSALRKQSIHRFVGGRVTSFGRFRVVARA